MIVRPVVEKYAEDHSSPESDRLQALAAETRELTALPQMAVGPLEGQFLQALVYALAPRAILEIGTFTGYSAITMAEVMPAGCRIVTLEYDDSVADIAQRHIEASPWAGQITLVRGDAKRRLFEVDGEFDLVFIDADKAAYGTYYEQALSRLSDRGMIVADNVLQFGGVANERDQGDDVLAMREFNAMVTADDRVDQVMLTVRDGVTLIRRRR